MFICIHFFHGNSSLNCNTFQIYGFFTRIGLCNANNRNTIAAYSKSMDNMDIWRFSWSLAQVAIGTGTGLNSLTPSFSALFLFCEDLKPNLAKIRVAVYAQNVKKWPTNNCKLISSHIVDYLCALCDNHKYWFHCKRINKPNWLSLTKSISCMRFEIESAFVVGFDLCSETYFYCSAITCSELWFRCCVLLLKWLSSSAIPS